jgi:uncharacterized protein (DUF362 family)
LIMTKHNRFAQNHCPLNRREFIKLAGLVSAAAIMPPGFVNAASKLADIGSEAGVSVAGISQGVGETKVLNAVRKAAEAATDFSWLSRGDSVFIKPVVNSGNPYPATTSPVGVKALVSLLKEKGAGRVVVSDMSGIQHVKLSQEDLQGSTRELMKSCGVAGASQEAGAELYFPEEEGWDAFFEDGPDFGPNWKSGIMMPKVLKEMDHLVLLPRCSRHVLASATLGMKAAVGYWRTDSRLEYHHDAATFHEKTAEANTVPSLNKKLRLTLTVADKVQATFGPDKGYVVTPETGLIFASESLVAHDMVSLSWLLDCRRAVPEEQKSMRYDPYTSQFVVNMGNRWAVRLLGGIGQAAGADTLVRNDLATIWDDRVLKRAFELFGGVPRLRLIEANAGVSKEMIKRLTVLTKTLKKT